MITDDAILVNMALGGKHEAFDELVRKHRSRVLSAARMLVDSADGAEDVAQQAFVAAFANLRMLKDPTKFRPWLLTITRRCAVRQWTAQSREVIGFDDAVMTSPCYQPVDDSEVRARIAEMLAELTTRDRNVVVMHYLDGCSSQEIGDSLGIPAGTVRRILHESRSSLRASSELMKGVGEMVQKEQGPRRMGWWISGDWPHGVMDGVLKQSICLTINKKGLTPEQIAKRVDANETYVREALDALEAEELVENVGRGRYRNTFIALDAEERIKLNQEIRQMSERAADVLEEGLPELQAAWENSPKPAQGFGWDAGIWLATAMFVCQWGLPRNGREFPYPEPPLHPASGKRYWLGGEEVVAPEQALWSLSLCFHGHQPVFSYGFLWSEGLGFSRRPWSSGHDASLSKERLLLLAAVARGSTDIDSAAKAADLDMEKAREMAANAIELGFLERTGDEFKLAFPVFTSEDDPVLLPAVDRVSGRLAEILDPTMPLIDEKLFEFGFGQWEEQFPLWHSKPRYGAAAEGIRVLYKRGLLPYPGDPAPANFCMWGYYGQTKLFSSEK